MKNHIIEHNKNVYIGVHTQSLEMETFLQSLGADHMIDPFELSQLQNIHEKVNSYLTDEMDKGMCAECGNLVFTSSLKENTLDQLPLYVMHLKTLQKYRSQVYRLQNDLLIFWRQVTKAKDEQRVF